MLQRHKFYIDGEWTDPVNPKLFEVINPATEEAIATICLGQNDDVQKAVQAAKRAFQTFGQSSKDDRISLLKKIIAVYKTKLGLIGEAISLEMGAPLWLAKGGQAESGLKHFEAALSILKSYPFIQIEDSTAIVREPIGVCALITPWNWPINQIASKVAPAIAAGCTIVLKPSELAPLSAIVLADIFHEAGVPAGVFNMVHGDGPTVGSALSSHPDVDMVSFTGSTRGGIAVAKAAANTVKRVTQELGGKSPNIILEDANLSKAVSKGVFSMMINSGQSCNAPSRMLVPRNKHEDAIKIAKETVEKFHVSDPMSADTPSSIGPVANKNQFEKIQRLINEGIQEGATLVAGGPGRPQERQVGYFVKPTIFAHVRNDMTIAREEIFGPVLCIIPYDTEEDAIRIANDTPYGLSAYVQSEDLEHAKMVAATLRAGNIHINGISGNFYTTPFGGYKQSGNGRECGRFGFEEYLEIKAITGYEGKPK